MGAEITLWFKGGKVFCPHRFYCLTLLTQAHIWKARVCRQVQVREKRCRALISGSPFKIFTWQPWLNVVIRKKTQDTTLTHHKSAIVYCRHSNMHKWEGNLKCIDLDFVLQWCMHSFFSSGSRSYQRALAVASCETTNQIWANSSQKASYKVNDGKEANRLKICKVW